VKRYGNLWERVLDWPNLLRAARLARRGKRHRYAVQRFQFRAEWELLRLRDELRAGTYEPGPFATHTITRPKPRLISAAPYRDRVVHHALMGVLEPIFDAHFHEHSFACRKGKGTHAAADRLQRLLARNRYLIACDVQKFFPSIDHEILKGLLRRRIKDRNVLALVDLLIDRSNEQDGPAFYFPGDNLFAPYERRRGLPIGNLTSQWFANLYLDGLDHFITSRLGFGGYVRYCDDFVILGNDRAALRDAFARVTDYANGLRLKQRSCGPARRLRARHRLRQRLATETARRARAHSQFDSGRDLRRISHLAHASILAQRQRACVSQARALDACRVRARRADPVRCAPALRSVDRTRCERQQPQFDRSRARRTPMVPEPCGGAKSIIFFAPPSAAKAKTG